MQLCLQERNFSKASDRRESIDGVSLWQSLSESAQLVPMIDALIATMRQHDYAEKDLFEMSLVVEEALTNALKHGNKQDRTKDAWIRWSVDPRRVLVIVEDEGDGFDPTRIPDPTRPENLERPSGRGLFLMRCYTSWMRFNKRGNRVAFCKRRSDAPAVGSWGKIDC
jgi:serine/threonine-protein kinase RsbW